MSIVAKLSPISASAELLYEKHVASVLVLDMHTGAFLFSQIELHVTWARCTTILGFLHGSFRS